MFTCGMILLCSGGLRDYWWATSELGFFISAWSGFHWAEFAATAGWNLEKCSVDCEYLAMQFAVTHL
jgi:protein-S-isoprenylcysteine O-methyltransferase